MTKKLLILTAFLLTIALVFCACASDKTPPAADNGGQSGSTDNGTSSGTSSGADQPTGDSGSQPSGNTDQPAADQTVSTYTVTFDYSDGVTKDTLTVKAGELINPPKTPERTDYQFNGWLRGTKTTEFPYEVSGDVTFKASWTYVDPYFYTQ
ncbi:MAG: InlB B-repeat-containing protein, partial [Clostridia bacterium]|nr:InlB B-repeat-containing protein [Clostridia bacterium]